MSPHQCATRVLLLWWSALAVAALPPAPLGQPRSKWIPFPPLTDEFAGGDVLDPVKWSTAPRDIGWRGRKPGLFDPGNVFIHNGTLTMRARAAQRNVSWPPGYDNFTTSAIHSVARTSHGYFEVRARSGSSSVSSSFWFHQNDGNGSWTEIDVFESVGSHAPHAVAGMNSSMMCTHTHVFQLAGVPQADLPAKCGCSFDDGGLESHARLHRSRSNVKPCTMGACVPTTWHFDGGFHVYGLEWNATTLAVFADGKQVGESYDASCFGQSIGLDLDRETMPGWMGIPDRPFAEVLPFEIDYVRAWKLAAYGSKR